MRYFVDKDSIVREIWGKSDTILFIFAGAAAEFALNKAVDWLYFTGRLPADPLGRLFSTVAYARKIIFSENQDALRAIDALNAIHSNVETTRAEKIPDWAYRDVLFLLIDYSITSFELLERRLTTDEKKEVFHVFNRLGERMGIGGLPEDIDHWKAIRNDHLVQHLKHSDLTSDLFKQYRKHLGPVRYKILLEAQKLVVPPTVRELLHFSKSSFFYHVVTLYKLSKRLRLDAIIKEVILPVKYKHQIKAMDKWVAA
jgi:uncharacterized protein (DUF2236 family)